tara:strand:+ start:2274 stop:2489 length:216 start_codon:yes stop_codon:yes gene_type:complete
MENNLQNTIVNYTILDNSNNILDLNAIENLVITNTNIAMYNNQEKVLNLNEIDLPIEKTIPFIVRQNAFEK